ncbi:ribose-5-phosphate isomerase A [Chromobacterium phragmitis]|uniref:ribose-5-phosphate isomerase n=1 Tax=Chromobacterium phragmitis TaxID=2202141 RepID=A0ABV0IS92_9NEIS
MEKLPIYVDGADEINHHLHMIKGGGGRTGRK